MSEEYVPIDYFDRSSFLDNDSGTLSGSEISTAFFDNKARIPFQRPGGCQW